MSSSTVRVRAGKRKFSLLKYADTHFGSSTAGDEVNRYNIKYIGCLEKDKDKFMDDEFSAMRFWFENKIAFPKLFKVAKRSFGTPVSFCSSERVFNAVNRIVSRDRANTSSTLLEDIVVIRSSE